MVERVARAICLAGYGMEEGWEHQTEAAEAAIKAIRQETPTRALNEEEFANEAVRIWTQRLDQALGQPE